MDDTLLSISPAGCGQLVKMLITLEPRGIFGSNFALSLLKHCLAIDMQNGGEALPKIVRSMIGKYHNHKPQTNLCQRKESHTNKYHFGRQCLLVKMLKTFEPHCIF